MRNSKINKMNKRKINEKLKENGRTPAQIARKKRKLNKKKTV